MRTWISLQSHRIRELERVFKLDAHDRFDPWTKVRLEGTALDLLSLLCDMSATYQLLSSTRYDEFLRALEWNNDSRDNKEPTPFLHLPYHHDRLLEAAKRHVWDVSLSYLELKRRCWEAVEKEKSTNHSEDSLKVRNDDFCSPRTSRNSDLLRSELHSRRAV